MGSILTNLENNVIKFCDDYCDKITDFIEEEGEDSSETISKEEFSLWLNESGTYIPAVDLTVEKELPSGIYKINWNDRSGRYEIKKHEINTDNLIKFDNNNITPVLNEINDFWEKKDLYKKHGLVHKRCILLSGVPGTGKSALISILIKEIIKKEGLVFLANNIRDFGCTADCLSSVIRKIEPERPIITVVEDIDKIIADYNDNDTQILEFLDGKTSLEHHLCILTSNNTSELSEAMLRPSRIDMNFVIKTPDSKTRKQFLEAKGVSKDKLDEFTSKTKGMSFAELKEVFVGTEILGKSIDKVVEQIKNPTETKDYLTKSKGKLGL